VRKNRNLDVIAAEIRGCERDSVFTRGRLLNEAMDACQHGKWGSWLWDEFEMSASTADRLRGCAALAAKFPKLTKNPAGKINRLQPSGLQRGRTGAHHFRTRQGHHAQAAKASGRARNNEVCGAGT
jgi:hypothetical protein